jgi:hypothetical protein
MRDTHPHKNPRSPIVLNKIQFHTLKPNNYSPNILFAIYSSNGLRRSIGNVCNVCTTSSDKMKTNDPTIRKKE